MLALPGLVTVISVVPAPTTVNVLPVTVATAVFEDVYVGVKGAKFEEEVNVCAGSPVTIGATVNAMV